MSQELFESKGMNMLDASNITLQDFHFYVTTVLRERNEMNLDGFHEEFEVRFLLILILVDIYLKGLEENYQFRKKE
jgi:hypothetical protein